MKPCLTNKTSVQENLENILTQEPNNENHSVSDVLCGDFYIIGKLWIEAVKAALIGAKNHIIPVVKAAKVEDEPQKPPAMKYTELPLYKSPHVEYKDYLDSKQKCPDANVKLLHESLLPHIKNYRQIVKKNLCDAKCLIEENLQNVCKSVHKSKRDFKQTMRDPDNFVIRQVVVLFGGTAGYFLGGGGGVPRRVFFTSLGLLSAGALCFPKETDEIFRDVAFSTGKVVIAVYNNWCAKGFVLREKLPCSDDVPAMPPERKPIQCPPVK